MTLWSLHAYTTPTATYMNMMAIKSTTNLHERQQLVLNVTNDQVYNNGICVYELLSHSEFAL